MKKGGGGGGLKALLEEGGGGLKALLEGDKGLLCSTKMLLFHGTQREPKCTMGPICKEVALFFISFVVGMQIRESVRNIVLFVGEGSYNVCMVS